MIRLALMLALMAVAGCAAMEGDGFYNSGKPHAPARCVEASPNLIRCTSP